MQFAVDRDVVYTGNELYAIDFFSSLQRESTKNGSQSICSLFIINKFVCAMEKNEAGKAVKNMCISTPTRSEHFFL